MRWLMVTKAGSVLSFQSRLVKVQLVFMYITLWTLFWWGRNIIDFIAATVAFVTTLHKYFSDDVLILQLTLWAVTTIFEVLTNWHLILSCIGQIDTDCEIPLTV